MGDLWVHWGMEWHLLTRKNEPGVFPARGTLLARFKAEGMRFLDLNRASQAALAQAAAAEQGLTAAARDLDTTQVKGLAEAADAAVEASDRLAGSFSGDGEPIEMREILGLDKALRSIRGEMQNNLAKLGELDADIKWQEAKLKEAADLDKVTRNRVEERLRDLFIERDAWLETLSTNRTALRSQVTRIRETIARMLNEDTTLAEKVKTLFREQGITIVSILTALGMTVSSLVAWLAGASGGTPAPTPCAPRRQGRHQGVG
jgi:chromosome segregation ATPase